MKQHKYVTSGTGSQTITYCEWCGLIIFYANDTGNERNKRFSDRSNNLSCPCSQVTVPESLLPPQETN